MNKQLDLQLIYPSENYPKEPIIIKLKSKVMPHKLVEMLLKKSEALAKKLSVEGKDQVKPVYDFLETILESNNLIPAWSELSQIKQVLRLPNNSPDFNEKDELKMLEKAGKIKIKLREKAFYLDFEIVVSECYPYEKPTLKFTDHNYDPNFAKLF